MGYYEVMGSQLWDTMKGMTGLSIKHKSLAIDNEVEFANKLNTFLFDKGNISDQGVTIINSVIPEWSELMWYG